MKILNLTQHAATPDQLQAGVFDPSAEDRKAIAEAITFDALPTHGEMVTRAYVVASIANRYFKDEEDQGVMIGGAPFFQTYLARELQSELPDAEILFAFSQRKSVEEVNGDGETVKRSVFAHAGFVQLVHDIS